MYGATVLVVKAPKDAQSAPWGPRAGALTPCTSPRENSWWLKTRFRLEERSRPICPLLLKHWDGGEIPSGIWIAGIRSVRGVLTSSTAVSPTSPWGREAQPAVPEPQASLSAPEIAYPRATAAGHRPHSGQGNGHRVIRDIPVPDSFHQDTAQTVLATRYPERTKATIPFRVVYPPHRLGPKAQPA